eukprot:2284161-Pleurochrysis_carterae.AAC.3
MGSIGRLVSGAASAVPTPLALICAVLCTLLCLLAGFAACTLLAFQVEAHRPQPATPPPPPPRAGKRRRNSQGSPERAVELTRRVGEIKAGADELGQIARAQPRGLVFNVHDLRTARKDPRVRTQRPTRAHAACASMRAARMQRPAVTQRVQVCVGGAHQQASDYASRTHAREREVAHYALTFPRVQCSPHFHPPPAMLESSNFSVHVCARARRRYIRSVARSLTSSLTCFVAFPLD